MVKILLEGILILLWLVPLQLQYCRIFSVYTHPILVIELALIIYLQAALTGNIRQGGSFLL